MDEDKRDFSHIISTKFVISDRKDEIGLLREEFIDIVTKLYNQTMDKRLKLKYQQNPFFVPLFFLASDLEDTPTPSHSLTCTATFIFAQHPHKQTA